MTAAKRLAFSAAAILLAVIGVFALVLAADLYLHRKAERLAGVNIWGYRGPSVGRKKPGEHRIVAIGGSTVFGYGVRSDEAFPAQLEADLRPLSKHGAPISVVNLGFNAQGAFGFRLTLDDYRWMEPDLAIFYEGYNDITGDNEFVGRRDSPVFRLTGYYPIFQTVFREKAMALRYGGDLDAAYRGQTVFKPGIADRATATALEAAVTIQEGLDRQLGRLKSTASTLAPRPAGGESLGCAPRWTHYCRVVHDGITTALGRGTRVLVVTQPYIEPHLGEPAHREQQASLRAMLKAYFAGNPQVGYADLGDAVDLRHSADALDGMHLGPKGNAIIARRLVAPVAALMPEAFTAPTETQP